MKDEAYVVNLDDHKSKGPYWIALYMNGNYMAYFNSFGSEHVPEEIKRFIIIKNIITYVFRIQAYGSIMCEHFCIGFIDFMFKARSLADFANLLKTEKMKRMTKQF